ncbi:MAG: chemotaxis protein [Firmicutes bacterium HGW-Firmicutes-15]|nr:MAG: chemotaxis protein [Firmicutes bacterium HGW-Firmicutes-15]
MITTTTVACFKEIAPLIVNLFPDGVIFATTDREQIDWKLASDVFNIPAFAVGAPVRVNGGPYNAMREQKTTTEKVPRALYGMRLILTAIPVFDQDLVVGTLVIGTPRLNTIAKAFDTFAPMVANMFPEGGFLYMSDLEKIAYRQAADKFDMPDLQKGTLLTDRQIASEVIRTKKTITRDLDANIYGVPVAITCYPQFDEDDPSKVVATFGVAIPRAKAVQLKNMASNMDKGLEEIASVLEELASSATEIASNEHHLHQNVKDVYKLSEDINAVLGFIQQIADETKMLGLNAAIEAARAGEAGRGFGVVAEEIRKLSDQSKGTVVKIRQLTENIKNKIKETTQNSELTLRASEEQAAATQEMTASVQEVTNMAAELDMMAKDM